MNLRRMRIGQTGIISSVKIGGSLGLRIREMGLVPGTKVTVTGRAPLYDPVKLRINGQTLTLRNSEADFIEVDSNQAAGEDK
ncbi:MAG: ferrous iron transport protein A [Candidatus Electrothrix sp. AR4]|nr:ferrous iron transport protein A [Candidatus Electrothrix sp. AR4]